MIGVILYNYTTKGKMLTYNWNIRDFYIKNCKMKIYRVKLVSIWVGGVLTDENIKYIGQGVPLPPWNFFFNAVMDELEHAKKIKKKLWKCQHFGMTPPIFFSNEFFP